MTTGQTALLATGLSMLKQTLIDGKKISLQTTFRDVIVTTATVQGVKYAIKFGNTSCELSSRQKKLWEMRAIIPGKNPDVWRMDVCGNPIKYCDYANRYSQYGWELDHMISRANGGSNDISNLHALQWYENVIKGSDNWRLN